MDSDSFLSQLSAVLNEITITQPSTGAIIAIVVAAVLLFFSAFASASEIAFFSLSPAELNEIEEGKDATSKRIARLLNDKERLLATILITNNFVNVTIVMLCNYAFMDVFQFGSPVAEFLILTVVLTFLLLLFGEIVPKIYSVKNTLKFCRFASSGISFCYSLFKPFSGALVRSTFFVNKYFAPKGHQTTVDELEHALELTDKKEITDESSILQGIIRFGGETAKEVMTSRMDMVALDIRTPYKDVMRCIIDNVYSRIPIYQGTVDNIKGVLYIKDLLPHLGKADNFHWQSLIRPAYFVPETKMIDVLLKDFQTSKVHIAIVVDEFGGTSGLVTMEDIIEEIVGEIRDEYDDEDRSFAKLDDHTWVFEAKTLLTDFYKITKLDEDTFEEASGESDTVGGLILELKGDFPKVHEKIVYQGYEFEVLSLNKRRILKVKFTSK